MITYKYDADLGLRFCNHARELKNLNLDKLQMLLSNPCDCKESKFLYGPAQHVVTGDLNIVSDPILRSLFEKGTNFREPREINWNACKDSALAAIDVFAHKVKKKFHISSDNAKPFIDYLKRIVNKRIAQLEGFVSVPNRFDSKDRKKVYSQLCQKYIITVADKAANNFVFVCKKYYMMIMCKELGLCVKPNGEWEIKGNEVYTPILDMSAANIMNSHFDIVRKFNLKVSDEDEILPKLFAIPKLHKMPYKFRFIAGARHSSLKPVAVLLHRILGQVLKMFHSYCLSVTNRTNMKVYWAVKSSCEVLSMLDNVKKPECLFSADFSTLYTSLPHTEVKKQIRYILNLVMKNYLFICGNWRETWASNVEYDNGFCLTKEQIIVVLDTVLDNSIVTFAGIPFRQISGIPMGGNASPDLADLTLSAYEFQFMTCRQNANRYQCQNTSRYIDDLLNVNNPNFLTSCSDIYPDSLPLNDTSVSDVECNYLDLKLKVTNDNKIVTEVYNKTDDFQFEVVRYVHAESNVSHSIGLNTFYGQLVRIARISSTQDNFEIRITELIKNCQERGYTRKELKTCYVKFQRKWKPLLSKFGLHDKNHNEAFIKRRFNN